MKPERFNEEFAREKKAFDDAVLNRFGDKFNAYMKAKGLEEDFANFKVPVSQTIRDLQSHEIRNK